MDETPDRDFRDKLGAALPVGLTALATILAGLSTGEMSRAMYWRSAAAQDQAKTNDQWGFAGHKRDRALIVETTAATLRAMADVQSPAGKPPEQPETLARVEQWLRSGLDAPAESEAVRKMLEVIHARRPEAEVVKLARLLSLKPDGVATDIDRGHADAAAVEREMDVSGRDWTPIPPQRLVDSKTAVGEKAAVYERDCRRYRAESSMNFWVGYLYEVRVAASTAESDRHRVRSERFFYAMLAAQLGAVVSSLALARKRQSALWLIAGLAGMVAVGFGGYVYLTI